MSHDFDVDIAAVQRTEAMSRILEVVCRTTGMGFAAVARVTEERWIACAVRDEIEFGLQPGGELSVATTLCNEIRHSGEALAINHVAEEQAYCGHPTPAMYGFQSYISVPIVLAGGAFFGTLCAIDPRPARVNTPCTSPGASASAANIRYGTAARAGALSCEACMRYRRSRRCLRRKLGTSRSSSA